MFKLNKQTNWKRLMYISGVITLVLGAIDPMEGSVVIALGSILLAVSVILLNDQHKWLFLSYSLMIVTGVGLLFLLSSLGGFGGNSSLSAWWGLLILPYPLGWLASIILLITRGVKKKP